MLRLRLKYAAVPYLLLLTSSRFAVAQGQEQTASLLLRFQEMHDVPGKEKTLNSILQRGRQAGPPLLQLAKTTGDNDTRWLAIRGLGMLKFEAAAPFLVESLKSEEHYVRANAARALGELRYSSAGPALIHLLEADQDDGVIQQTSLALWMIKAKDAIPTLKSRMSFDSLQTRCWLLDAIAGLGSQDDVPFLAKYLYSSDNGIPLCATRALAALAGEDLGLPKASGLFAPDASISKARMWWEQTQQQ
jgi:HEAT repeat protein